MVEVKCSACGTANELGKMFCKNCGTKLQVSAGVLEASQTANRNRKKKTARSKVILVFLALLLLFLVFAPVGLPPIQPVPAEAFSSVREKMFAHLTRNGISVNLTERETAALFSSLRCGTAPAAKEKNPAPAAEKKSQVEESPKEVDSMLLKAVSGNCKISKNYQAYKDAKRKMLEEDESDAPQHQTVYAKQFQEKGNRLEKEIKKNRSFAEEYKMEKIDRSAFVTEEMQKARDKAAAEERKQKEMENKLTSVIPPRDKHCRIKLTSSGILFDMTVSPVSLIGIRVKVQTKLVNNGKKFDWEYVSAKVGFLPVPAFLVPTVAKELESIRSTPYFQKIAEQTLSAKTRPGTLKLNSISKRK